MPKFYCRKTTVQLSVADLAKTTIDPKSYFSSAADTVAIAAEFVRESKYGTLTELPLYTEGSNSHIRHLDAPNNFPFFMVHAGKHFFDPSTKQNHSQEPERIKGSVRSKRSKPNTSSAPKGHLCTPAVNDQAVTDDTVIQSLHEETLRTTAEDVDCDAIIQEYRRRKVPPILTPHALCLTVFLSERSFRPKLDPKSNRKIYHDVKIDVYFNGELSGSSLVLGRCHTDAHLFDEQIVRFSGRKISRYVEKPWVMVPSGQTPDGNLRVPKRSKGPYLGATQRWAELAQSLEAEAEKGGRNELGELSILGRYLSSLAKLAMPSEVEGMQKAGGPKFGVIDVVVTSGKGHKDNSSHTQLLHPTPMRVKSGENGVDTNSHVNTPETIANTSTEPTTNEPETPMTRAYNELMILSSQNRAIFDRTPYLRAYLSQGSPPTNEKNTNKASLSLQSFLPSSSRTGSRATARRSIPSPVGEDGDEDGCLVPTRNEGIHTFPTSPSSVWRSRRSDSILLLSTNGVHCDTRRRTRQPFSPLDLLRSPSFPSRALRTGSRTSQRPSGLPDRTQRKHTNLTQKTYKGPSPPPQPKDSRSKRRSGETREMVSEGRMTLEQQMGLIEAEAQREQLETCQQDPEDQILSHGTRGSTRRSKSRNRDMQMPASPTTTVPTVNLADTSFADAHPNKKSKIVKLKISVPPANLDAISTLDKPHSSTNSPFSSTPTTAAPNFSPTRASRSPFAPSIPSTSRPVAAHTSASMWSIPPLSQDSALTYADEGVVRPVKAERNGEFVESAGDSGFVMGVRFLVG